MILALGTRSSDLAVTQAEHVQDLLESASDARVDLRTTDSLGDQKQDEDLADIGQVGVFTDALDRMVLDGTVDCAVHSLKDCPTDLPEGLHLAAIPARTTPFDVLVGENQRSLTELEPGTVIGTSSRRRRANILHVNPELSVEPCRGNVPTRMEKLEQENGDYDLLVLAAAGLQRLEIDAECRLMRTSEMLPAPGQGALGITCRESDGEVRQRLEAIQHPDSWRVCTAERALLDRLESGCQAPIGALARTRSDQLELRASVTAPDGSTRLEETLAGDPEDPVTLGRRMGDELLDRGARELIDS